VERAGDIDVLLLDVTGLEKTSPRSGIPREVAGGTEVLGVPGLKDVAHFARLRRMGIRTIISTCDDPLTAAAIAARAGADHFIAQATPEDKLRCIREEQAAGRLVAMAGDGRCDAPALAQADVGVAMNIDAREARGGDNLVDLDSNPAKLIEIVEIGRQLHMTRGALTTFSIASSVAKYFAILPALFGTLYLAEGESSGPLAALNVMRLHSPESAILSAVAFNALVLLAALPLALRGVAYRPEGAARVLRRNVLLYGLGGLLAPFLGIKAIDLALSIIYPIRLIALS